MYYAKGGAELAQMIGFGVTRPSRAPHRIELADVGVFYAYREGVLRDKPVLSIPIEELELRLGTQQITAGDGWAGDPVGLAVASKVLGPIEARALNWLSNRTTGLVVLDIQQHLANGARRAARLTFRRTSEAALRDELLPAFRAWVDAYVSAMTANRPDGPHLDGTLDQQHATIDAMHARQNINDHDARVLKSNASRPFIAALVAQIQGGQVARHDVQRIITQINDITELAKSRPAKPSTSEHSQTRS